MSKRDVMKYMNKYNIPQFNKLSKWNIKCIKMQWEQRKFLPKVIQQRVIEEITFDLSTTGCAVFCKGKWGVGERCGGN